MARKGRPSRAEALARAWRTIKAAGGDGAGEFDAKAVLICIASDPNVAPTARVGAVRMLRELEIAERNASALSAAGLD